MALSTQGYKGTRDFYPEDKAIQKWMFSKLREIVESFGYQQYDAPMIEALDLYLAKSGEEIVNDQLYNFTDRGGRKVAIRPEMTPSVSRMVAARRQELAYPLRWYSIPNLWRYERPQRGRLREHWQLNVDIFGVEDISADHEIILIADSILKAFKAPKGGYEIRINSRKLVDYLFRNQLKLNDQSFHDLSKLIDNARKIERLEFESEVKEIVGDKAAQLLEYIDVETVEELPAEAADHSSVKELKKLMKMLKTSKVESAKFDFSVIRGMDYYDDIIFEVFDTNPENNRSMFGGGRYDGLVGAFGVEPVPTVGFGMGDVTLQNFLELHKLLPALRPKIDAAIILIGDVYEDVQKVLAVLRAQGLNVSVDSTGRKLDAKIKNAVKSDLKWAIFIGEQELESGKFKLKDLESGDEKELALDDLVTEIS